MSEQLSHFQFFCPKGLEDRAVEILEGIDCVKSIGFNAGATQKLEFDKETDAPIFIDGFGIVGQAIPTCVDRIMKALAAEQIAGYSRETQVIFFDPSKIITESNYTDDLFNPSGL